MTTDDTPYSIKDTWLPLYGALKDSAWDEEDVEDAVDDVHAPGDTLRVAGTLKWVYDLSATWKGAFELKEAVLATLKAAELHHGGEFLAPAQVKEMARGFAVFYTDFQVPADEYLDEFCGPVGWQWLNDHGRREVEQAVCKPSEVWVDENEVSGIYVFNRPGCST